MGKSLNKVQLIGNVGKDPDVKTIGSGGRVAEFSLATSRAWNDAGGSKQEKTEWHRCVAWNARGGAGTGLADIIERYVHKGDKIFVEGSIEYRSWQDKDGQTKYMTEIRVRDLILLSGRSGGDSDFDSSRRAPARKAAVSADTDDDDFEDFPRALEDGDDNLPF